MLEKNVGEPQRWGLGVNSIVALNHALLFKWIWRFMVSPNALWVRVVKAIYGERGLTV